MNAIVPFIYDGKAVRVTDQDGQPWFVLADVCALLAIRNPSDAASRLDDTEKARLNLGSGSDATIVSLAGMLTLMLRCRGAMKPGSVAYRVRKWITAEVVPTIMRTGGYGAAGAPLNLDDAATLHRLLIAHTARAVSSEERVAELEPKARALDQLTDSTGLMCMSDAAKSVGMGPKRFIAWLLARGWIFKRGMDGYTASQSRLDDRCLFYKTTRVPRRDGTMKAVGQVMVTAKGLAKCAEMLARP